MAANLGYRARHPPLLYIALATGTHQSQTDWASRSGAVKGSDSAFGPSREINPNILPLDLFLFLFLFFI